MISQQRLAKRAQARQHVRTRLLRGVFWLLTLSLVLHLLLVVLPAYSGGLLVAYNAGWRLKDVSFNVPIYTPYSFVTSLLSVPVLLLIAFVKWAAPLITIVWGVFLRKSWHQLAARTKWAWLATIILLWGLTLLTRTAATAFLIWLLD